MGELKLIQETVQTAARRRRLERALTGLWIGLLAGSAVWLVLLTLYKALPLPDPLLAQAWFAPLAGAILGLTAGGWRRIPASDAARLIESRQRLDQRLSTALELASRPSGNDSPWTRLVVHDAATAISGLRLAQLLPLHLPAFARWIPVLLAGVVGMGFVPEYRSSEHRRKQRESEAVRDTGRRLAALMRQELRRHEPAREEIKAGLENAGNLAERLSQGRLTKAEAMPALSNAAERLKEEARQLDSNPALQKLRQAARSPGGTPPPGQGNPALRKQLEKLQQTLGTTPPDALEKLAAQLQQARKMAAGMQGAAPDGASQQSLSQSLSQLAQNAAQMGMDAGALQQAIEALRDLNIDRVLKDLATAGRDLDKLRDLASKMAEMQKLMEQAGKDLAEQLERGQAQAAAETLDTMIEKLRQAGLTQEQLESLMKEVSKALKPAGEYGDVAKLLQKAADGLKDGKSPEAARNLAEAAKQLREMAREAADAEQLADSLAALQAAQAALASGRTWQPGQCQGGACSGCALHPNGRIGFSKGGKPGRGVGTWAEENGWLYYPQVSERWDNSGVQRPDQAARGHTDRGEGRLAENVAPTKLQGQFSPGSMPSITLKGVSIVGRSSVQYQQAVEAAQSEAQSALNQDQVPRAYRGAVKGYFDDLK